MFPFAFVKAQILAGWNHCEIKRMCGDAFGAKRQSDCEINIRTTNTAKGQL